MKSNEATLRAMQTQMTNMKMELRNEFKSTIDTRTNKIENQINQIMNILTNLSIPKKSPSGSGSLTCNTVANPRGDIKAITTRGGVSYDGPTIPPTPSPLPKEVERETEATKDKVQNTSSESTTHLQPPVVQILIPEPDVAPKTNPKPSILYLRGLTTKSSVKKLIIKSSTPFNENCSAVLLTKLPEKLRDPGKFLIPCDFLKLKECLALADLGASINLMPLSVWKKLSLSELTPTRMTLELSNRSVAIPVGVAEDVFVKVGKFYFPVDFVVADYDVDPRVPLILGRPFLGTTRALIDVHDVACEEYAQEVLGFSDSSKNGDPTPSDPIITSSSPSFSPFEGGDFILEVHPSLNLPPMKNEDLKQVNATMTKPSIEEPPKLELKDLPSHLEYAFLEGTDKLPVIISKELKDEEKAALLKGESNMHEVIKKEVIKLLDVGLIYPISDSPWVSLVYCVPKKGGMTVIENEDNELIPTRLVTGWRVCIDYRNLNDATRKDHFPLPFMDQMLEQLMGNEYYCFLDRFSGYFQIPIDPQDQEKTTFTCPYGTFPYRRMPFGLCNAPGTFQRCMMVIFHDMIEETMEVFMDDFSIFGDSFSSCLSHLDKMLKMYENTNLVLIWEKYHFMVKEGIVLGHKICKSRIEVDRAKVDVIAKLPHPTSVKGVRSFLCQAGFYCRFIQYFSKISRPKTHLLEKETPFIFSKECIDAFNILKKKLTEASILVAPDWDLPFEIMCDVSDYAVGAVLGQRKTKHFQHIHYARRGQNFNQGNNNYQAPNYQAQVRPSNELTMYMKSNEATLRAMQTKMTNMKTGLQNEFKSTIDIRTNKIENQNNQIMNILTNLSMQKQSPPGSGSLPSNSIANPRGDIKAITTRSGVSYDGPTIPPTLSPLSKEVERDRGDKGQSAKYKFKKLNDQKLREKANNQMLKFLQIFQRLHFDISFTDTLLHMPKFASTFKSLLSNKDKLFELESTPLNENCSAKLSLLKLTPTRMTLELANRSVAILVVVTEDVFGKVGKFYFPADFVVVDYDVDPRVPLILRRSFLRTARALIDVHGEELTLRVNDGAITFKVGHTLRYSSDYYDETVHQVNVIDVACEEYA
uniref:Reverse transcriptase domain-containing protein n=1 Tax=Tanacetum cinerariifolium TaxID=118510 RepID=A0A699HWZ7_TANCI|nr:reverse transcriptase domain-containing protein [Tanacetum cinerariifolium]